MRIEKKIYHAKKADYDAMVADVTAAFAWDKIVPDEANNYTTFKKHYGADDDNWTGMRVEYKSGYAPGFIICGYNAFGQWLYQTILDTTNSDRYVVYAIGANGFAMMRTMEHFPYGYEQANVIIGVGSSTDVITGEAGYCAFGTYLTSTTITNLYTIGKSTRKIVPFVPYHHYFSSHTLLCELALPLISPDCTTDVPDDLILTLDSRNDKTLFNGKAYYGLGNLLVPMDW